MSIESRCAQYGTVFGDWRIEKKLGAGSCGTSAVFSLYRENKSWREYSALKVISLIEERGLRTDLSSGRVSEYTTAVQEQRERAEQEVLLMAQLRGKTNIVDYLDHQFCDWHDDDSFGVDLLIRMEKLTDLRSQLKAERRYSVEEIIQIGVDMCQALQLCHGKNILHRDIKPENIFFNQDGDYKLGDFGISRIIGNTPAAFAHTSIGTVAYCAPEQLSGGYDHRVDIYSLGLVLYELSNGNRLPFAGGSYIREKEIQTRLVGTPLPVPQLLDPARQTTGETEAGLWRIIQKACAFRPEDRYQSAAEMLKVLSKLLEEIQNGAMHTMYLHKLSSASTADVVISNETESAETDNYETEALPLSASYGSVPENEISGSMDCNPAPGDTTPKNASDRTESAWINSVTAVRVKQTVFTPESVENTGKEWKNLIKRYIWLLPVLLAVAVAAIVLLHGKENPENMETMPPAHVHSWKAATCEQPASCSICGETDGEAPGHAWMFIDCNTPMHCTNCGVNEDTAPGHNWIPATVTNPATCDRCNETQGTSIAEDVLSSAAVLAQDRQYLAAIRQLQEAWDTYGYEGFYNAAAKYRTEFSVYNMSAVAAGKKNTALLNSNGAVTVVGDSSNGELKADDWTNMRAVGLGDRHIAGLTKDGIVVAVGRNKEDQYTGVQLWQNVVDLAVSDFHTVGLLADGTVVSSTGFNHAGQTEVENLMYAAGGKRIVAVSAGYDHTLALLEDGTVVGCGDRQNNKNNYNGSCAVGSWTDIAAIYSGTEFSAGLRLDGTVVVAGMDWNMSDWTDIVNLAAGDYFLLGLKSDGTVVYKAVYDENTDESFRYGCLQVEQWRNIVHIAAGSDHSVAVAADGTVYCIGADDKGQCALNRHNRNG